MNALALPIRPPFCRYSKVSSANRPWWRLSLCRIWPAISWTLPPFDAMIAASNTANPRGMDAS